MPKRKSIPVALTIAGSDSGGGAGIQADLKTFTTLGVHGTSVLTCITAQNPVRVYGIEPCSPAMVQQQLEAVFDQLQPHAVKTGMLFSEPIIQTVADFLENYKRVPLVVDPVMISTSGAKLLEPDAIEMLTRRLLPLATLVTPNLHEAEILTGRKIRSVHDMQNTARVIREHFGCTALVKGGHLPDSKEAVDYYHDGRWEMVVGGTWVRDVNTHGTGCTLSAAITSYLARGQSLRSAVKDAKLYITNAIMNSTRARKHFVLGKSVPAVQLMQQLSQKKLRKKMRDLLG
jgi:hydroxymethylpyrimidine/phosphomethylpyrimidine kinase